MSRIISVMAIVIVTVLTMTTTVTSAAERHIGPGPDRIIVLNPGQTKTIHNGNQTVTLTDFNIDGKIDCIANVEPPVFHPGAFGQLGVVTDSDYIDCFAPGVFYNDSIILNRYPDVVAWHVQNGNLNPSIYGYVMTNATSYICNIPFVSAYYGIQAFSVGAVGFGAARNYPPGFIGGGITVNCA